MSDKCTRNMFYGQHQGCFKVANGRRRTSLTAFFTSLKQLVDCSEFSAFSQENRVRGSASRCGTSHRAGVGVF